MQPGGMHRRSNAAGPVATGSLDQPRSPLAVTGAAPDPNARRASPGNLTTPTRADATSYATGSSVSGVQRQLLLPLVLPHLRMLPAILRMIVPAVSDQSRAGGTTTGNRPPGGSPWTGSTPRHAACSDPESDSPPRLVNRRGRPGRPRPSRATRPITAIAAAGRAACHPWMRHWMRRSRRSVTSRCTTNCTRSPAPHLPGRRAGGPCSRCSPVRYVTV